MRRHRSALPSRLDEAKIDWQNRQSQQDKKAYGGPDAGIDVDL